MSKPVIIRDAREDEHDVIQAVTWIAYEEYATIMEPAAWSGLRDALINAMATQATAECIVAEQDSSVVGSVMLFPSAVNSYGSPTACSNVPELRLLAVKPEVRGRGVGQMLVEACIRRAQQQGASALGLHSSISMQSAMHLYERMGFIRLPEGDFQPPGAELVMAYRLPLIAT